MAMKAMNKASGRALRVGCMFKSWEGYTPVSFFKKTLYRNPSIPATCTPRLSPHPLHMPTTNMPTIHAVTRPSNAARARRRAAFVAATRRHRAKSSTLTTTKAPIRRTTIGGDRSATVRARRRRRVRAFFDRRRVRRHYSGGRDSAYTGVVASRTIPSSGA